jgi:hypothetical protein
MLNYFARTIEPILTAVVDEFKRKFLTKTARTQGQSILFIRDPFKLVSLSKLGEIADKLTSTEILSTNEIRGKLGYKPSDSPRANQLLNKHINPASDEPMELETADEPLALPEGNQNGTDAPKTYGGLLGEIGDMPVSEFNAMIMQGQGPPV